MQQAHADLIELVNRLPSRAQDREADIAVLIDVGVQNLVEALDLWGLEGVFLCGLEGEEDLGVPVEGSLLVGYDLDVQLGDAPLVGVGDGHVLDPVLVVLLDVDLHSLFGGLEIGAVLVVELFLSLEPLGLEIL